MEEIYKLIETAKGTLLLKNLPRLGLRHTPNAPDTLISLMEQAKGRGVKIKILHEAQKKVYPLTGVVHRLGLGEFQQKDSGEQYVSGLKGAVYAIADERVIVLSQKGQYP
ncbi:MAG: hypothetical protein HQL31_13995, partial [Planctomycetes bacterium]|nr:hypothetical protein [Planctomycetota bacterium]